MITKSYLVDKVSASGDGKMILWDIASGERIRTFEGHDRGLACIEFKVSSIAALPRPALHNVPGWSHCVWLD